MKTKKSFLNMCVCGLVTAAALTLNGCASSMTEKALASSAFGPLTLTTDQYAEAYMDASDNQKFDTLILLARSNIQSGRYVQISEIRHPSFTVSIYTAPSPLKRLVTNYLRLTTEI